MNQRDFHRQLKILSKEAEGRFGYPFLSLKQVAAALALAPDELIRLLQAERAAGHIVMNPLDQKAIDNLPVTLLGLQLSDPDGEVRTYVSLALKP